MTDCEWWMDFMATMTMIGMVFGVILLLSIATQFSRFLLWWKSKIDKDSQISGNESTTQGRDQ